MLLIGILTILESLPYFTLSNNQTGRKSIKRWPSGQVSLAIALIYNVAFGIIYPRPIFPMGLFSFSKCTWCFTHRSKWLHIYLTNIKRCLVYEHIFQCSSNLWPIWWNCLWYEMLLIWCAFNGPVNFNNKFPSSHSLFSYLLFSHTMFLLRQPQTNTGNISNFILK